MSVGGRTRIPRREPIYQRSYVSMGANALIAGLGAKGYRTVVRELLRLITER